MPRVKLRPSHLFSIAGAGALLACSAVEFSRPVEQEPANSVPSPVARVSIPSARAPEAPRAASSATSAVVKPLAEEVPQPERVEPGPEVGSVSDDDGIDDTASSDPVASDVPETHELAVANEAEDGPKLYAIARQTPVYARPSFAAGKIGYLRAGASVKRSAEPVGFERCKQGFYRVMPEGFVCVGTAATLDANHPIVRLATVRPDRNSPLPYRYGRSRLPTPVVYTKLPNEAEQLSSEADLRRHRAMRNELAWNHFQTSDIPDLLANGQRTPVQFGYRYAPDELTVARALTNSAFALTASYDVAGRRFGLTTDLTLVPLDRLKPVEASPFKGVMLSEEVGLPVAFVRSRGAYVYQGNPEGGLRLARALTYRDAIPLSGNSRRVSGIVYLETKTGEWVREENVTRIDRMQHRPGWAHGKRTWIHVSILRQTLVAYEGEKPIYATLVSTGKDGLGDPLETHSTVRGQFLIHTKHVSITMSGDDVGDEFDLRDVPYVQYFTEGYAFHAAYWHDAFGQPRSHGCINLSPIDARFLFHWTDPPVPQAWHSALSLRGGTLVHITP